MRICDRIFWQKVQIAYFSAYNGIFKIAYAENMPQSPPQTQSPTLPPPYSKFLDPPLLVRFPTHSMHRLVTNCVVLDFLVL